MEDKTLTIKIESILGGHSPMTHFGRADQFRSSLGIDPGMPIDDSVSVLGGLPSGLLRPVAVSGSGTTVAAPMWLIGTPKVATLIYVYDYAGSVYTVPSNSTTITGLTDLNDAGTATGNGAAYYDNYVYFARDTTIARYGPLDGSAAFIDDYWVGTLGKTALVNTTYPTDLQFSLKLPNHYLHRHSDGKLYIADVVDNKGTIHYIATSKATVEGDTDNGSTYNKVQVGYGLWPTCIESYGSDLAVAFTEIVVTANEVRATRAKVAFWDTTSQNVNKITWVEFPDEIITAMKNVNGVLYLTSGNQGSKGFRLSRFVGGYTFEQVAFISHAISPFPGAIDGESNRLVFGAYSNVPETGGSIYSYGLGGLSVQGTFNILSARGYDGDNSITAQSCLISALKNLTSASVLGENNFIMGTSRGVASSYHGIVLPSSFGSTGYDNAPSVFWSQLFRIGQPFKIKKIRIPLAQAIATNMIVTPKIYTDDGAGTTYTLTAINNTNDPGAFNAVRRSGSSGETMTGKHNFWLELRWTGSVLCVVGLPITIEYELIDD